MSKKQVNELKQAFDALRADLKRTEPKKKRKKKANSNAIMYPGQMPNSRINFSTRGDKFVVRGMEMIQDVKGTVTGGEAWGRLELRLDPGATVFPRAAAFSAAFQRYRFKRLRLIYHCGCPSTTQGNLALAILQDYGDSTPTTIAQLSAYAQNFIGSVTRNMQTKEFIYNGNEWWLTEAGIYGVDPTKAVQLAICGVTSLGAEVRGGYLFADYELEFTGARPVAPRSYVGTHLTDYSNSVGAAGRFRVDAPQGGDRYMMYQQAQLFGDQSTTDLTMLAMEAGKNLYNWYYSLGAASVSGEEYEIVEKKDKYITRTASTREIKFPNRQVAMANQHLLVDFQPMAANDVTSRIISQLSNGGGTVVVQTVSGNYPSTATIGLRNEYEATEGEVLYAEWICDGNEVRTCDVSKSYLQVDKLDSQFLDLGF